MWIFSFWKILFCSMSPLNMTSCLFLYFWGISFPPNIFFPFFSLSEPPVTKMSLLLISISSRFYFKCSLSSYFLPPSGSEFLTFLHHTTPFFSANHPAFYPHYCAACLNCCVGLVFVNFCFEIISN